MPSFLADTRGAEAPRQFDRRRVATRAAGIGRVHEPQGQRDRLVNQPDPVAQAGLWCRPAVESRRRLCGSVTPWQIFFASFVSFVFSVIG